MLQLRLTKKCAKALNVKQLEEPLPQDNVFNDWFVDIFYVHHKKIAMFTHGLTKLSFFSFFGEVGGWKKIPESLKDHLLDYLTSINQEECREEIETLFQGNYRFCKTNDRKVNGHMNDFISGATFYATHPNLYNGILSWDDITKRIHGTPMNSIGFATPEELFLHCCCKKKH